MALGRHIPITHGPGLPCRGIRGRRRRAGRRLRCLDAASSGSRRTIATLVCPCGRSRCSTPIPRRGPRSCGSRSRPATPPVLPQAPAGSPFPAVAFEGLTATGYVDTSGSRPRLAWSFRATAVRAATPKAQVPQALSPRRAGRLGAVPVVVLRPHRRFEPASARGARAPLRRRRTGRRRADPPDRRLHLADPPRRRVGRRLGKDRSSRRPPVDAVSGSRLRPRRLWQSTRVALPALLGAVSPRRLLPRRGGTQQATRPEESPPRLPPTRSSSRRSPHPRSGRSIAGSSMPVASAAAGSVVRPRFARTASRCAVSSVMPRAIPGSARRSVRTATTTRPRLCGTRTLERCGGGRSRTCRASSQP